MCHATHCGAHEHFQDFVPYGHHVCKGLVACHFEAYGEDGVLRVESLLEVAQGRGLSVLPSPVDAEVVAPVHHLFDLPDTLVYVHHVVLLCETGARRVESPHDAIIACGGGAGQDMPGQQQKWGSPAHRPAPGDDHAPCIACRIFEVPFFFPFRMGSKPVSRTT